MKRCELTEYVRITNETIRPLDVPGAAEGTKRVLEALKKDLREAALHAVCWPCCKDPAKKAVAAADADNMAKEIERKIQLVSLRLQVENKAKLDKQLEMGKKLLHLLERNTHGEGPKGKPKVKAAKDQNNKDGSGKSEVPKATSKHGTEQKNGNKPKDKMMKKDTGNSSDVKRKGCSKNTK